MNDFLAGRDVVVSISGGKDSAAAALYLREAGIKHIMVNMDTGWEHPAVYEHLDYLEQQLGLIIRLVPKMPTLPDEIMPRVLEIEALVGRSPSGFVRWAVYKGMFPSRLRRYCTHELKVKPFLRWVDAQDAEIVNVVGIRADESQARAALPEHESMPGAEHVYVWRPLIRWSEADVIAIHQRHALRPCPLYLQGSTRVGCWPCIMSNKGELEMLGRDDRRIAAITMLEDLVGECAKVRGARDRALFQSPVPQPTDDGITYPCMPIAKVLEWARTAHGGRQMRLGAWGKEDGCVRWGMCETEAP